MAGVALTFRSAGAAARHLARHPTIRLVQDHGDGSATYELIRRGEKSD